MTLDEFRRNHLKKWKSRTAAELTNAVLDYLGYNGFIAWRQNNAGIWNEKKGIHVFHGRKGVSDVLGIQKGTGRMIAVEIKFGKDTLSEDQESFLKDINRAGGMALEVRELNDLIEYLEKLKTNETEK